MKLCSFVVKLFLLYFLHTPRQSVSVAGYANQAPSSSVADRVEALKQEGEREKALIFLGSRFPLDKLQQQVCVWGCVFLCDGVCEHLKLFFIMHMKHTPQIGAPMNNRDTPSEAH